MEKLFEELVNTVKTLRGPGGCPWDKKQTHRSLIKCLKEESGEVVLAIKNNDDENLQEELGDLLLQVLFHANLAEERGKFTISDVIKGINDKLIRRHPHVFGNAKAKNAKESLAVWRSVKAREKLKKK